MRDFNPAKDRFGSISVTCGNAAIRPELAHKQTYRRTYKMTRMPSRPGEFHPEPLTGPDLTLSQSSGSCHRAKAAAFH